MLYDPEIIGSVLRAVLEPVRKVNDYQDYALWRRLVVAEARVHKAASSRTLVISMTVWRRDYFDPIVAGLRRVEPDLYCFRLTASRDVLIHRISSDSEDTGAYGWRMSHVDVCLRGLQDSAFGEEIRTDDLTPAEVADRILNRVGTRAG